MSTITRETGITRAVIQKPENTAEFLAPGFAKFMKSGRLHPLFNIVMTEGRRILDENRYEAPGKKQHAMNKSLGQVKQALAVAAKRTILCCGFPLEVRGGYDRQTDRHNLLVRCNNCGGSLYFEEQGVCRYLPGKFERGV